MQASFQRTDEGWGIKIQARRAADQHTGKTIFVQRRDGRSVEVVLGRVLDRWNGGRSAVYEIAR